MSDRVQIIEDALKDYAKPDVELGLVGSSQIDVLAHEIACTIDQALHDAEARKIMMTEQIHFKDTLGVAADVDLKIMDQIENRLANFQTALTSLTEELHDIRALFLEVYC